MCSLQLLFAVDKFSSVHVSIQVRLKMTKKDLRRPEAMSGSILPTVKRKTLADAWFKVKNNVA